MNSHTQLLIFLVAALSLAVVEGTCTCSDVCPSYVDGAWFPDETCPPPDYNYGGGLKFCVYDDGYGPCEHYPEGGCVCNVFGCNCEACYCSDNRRTATHEAKSSCDDHITYTSKTRREKVKHLASFHCTNQRNSTSGEVVRRKPRKSIHTIVELIADVNDDGELSCEEFNNAYFQFDGFDFLCVDRKTKT